MCAMLSSVYAIDDIIRDLKDTRTNESLVMAKTIETLHNEKNYSEKVIRAAYDLCEEETGETLPSCLMHAIHVQKLLDDHKLHICTFDFLVGVVAECAIECFEHYNVRCLECVGKPIPNLINCVKNGPDMYANED
ncbi:hypothetical protein BaOVIS_014520 [Babesia ovis]|uniref:Uncharacterized protein n=1 Tax=Babesia ovis TaxID=5869 RepID=A0A9W5TC79_BABOV|nr:hypothetical protein BaOVIS_014520 [Babesia ovis]